MERPPHRAALRLALAASALTACGGLVRDPYDGSAWSEPRPPVAWPDGGAAVLTNNQSDTVSVAALGSLRVAATVPVGFDPVGTDGPHHLALDSRAGVLFTALSYPPPVVSTGPHGNHGLSSQPGTVVRLSLRDFSVLARQDTDYNPGDILLTPDRRTVLVTHFDLAAVTRPQAESGDPDAPRRGNLRLFDADTLRPLGSVAVCIGPHGMAVTADSRRAWVSCAFEDAVAAVDLDAARDPARAASSVVRVPVGPGALSGTAAQYQPYSVTLSPDGRFVYAGCLGGTGFAGSVRMLDTAGCAGDLSRCAFDPARVGFVGTRGQVFFMALDPAGTTLYVPTQGPDQLLALRADTLALRSQNPARALRSAECIAPHQVAFGPDGRGYLVCEGDFKRTDPRPGTLLAFDPATLQTTAMATLGLYPDAVVFTSTP